MKKLYVILSFKNIDKIVSICGICKNKDTAIEIAEKADQMNSISSNPGYGQAEIYDIKCKEIKRIPKIKIVPIIFEKKVNKNEI